MVIAPTSSNPAARVAERRLDARYIGSINGCYTLSDRKDPQNGGLEVYACRVQSVSSNAAALTAPVIGKVGESLTAHFEGLGIIRGHVVRKLTDGMVMSIVASDEQREKLVAKIEWLRKRSARASSDKRAHKRVLPRDPRSTVTLADGTTLTCFVIDMSRSGVAISAKHVATIGEAVVVGSVAGKVIRVLDVGFAVQLDALQEAGELDTLLTGFKPKSTESPASEPAAVAGV